MIFTPFPGSGRKRTMAAANYGEWTQKAQAKDRSSGAAAWRGTEESDLYGYASIRKRLDTLRAFRKSGDDHALLYNLNEGIHGNMDGIANEALYGRAIFGTKTLIEDYIAEIDSALHYLSTTDDSLIDREEKRAFFERAHHCYGQSALLLSGSGNYLFFHLGVAKAMWSEGLLPSVISGSSGGSVVGAIVCTHTDAELAPYFDAEWLYRQGEEHGINGKTGEQVTQEQSRKHLDLLIPDLTFQEAFELTGRHLNISVAPAEKHQNSRLLNAIASPNVMVREAVLASCAVPGLFDPVALMAKNHKGERVPYLEDRRWVDGSVTNDLPAKRLARLYGVNHHIVSQANPLIAPFITDTKQPDNPLAWVQQASVASMKAWANASFAIWEKPLALVPKLNAAANLAMSIIDQDYVGDITIISPSPLWSLTKALRQLSVEDMRRFVELGEEETWPKIEMIRNQTRISLTHGEINRRFQDLTARPAQGGGRSPRRASPKR